MDTESQKNISSSYIKISDRRSQITFRVAVIFLLTGIIFITHDFFADYIVNGFFAEGSLRQLTLLVLGIISIILVFNNQKTSAAYIASTAPVISFFILPLFIKVDHEEMYYLNSLILPASTIIPLLVFSIKQNFNTVLYLCLFIFVSNLSTEYIILLTKFSGSSHFYQFYTSHVILFSLAKSVIWSFYCYLLIHLFKKNELYEESIINKNYLLEQSNSLIDKQKSEITTQHDQLKKTHDALNAMHLSLEKIVDQRTKEIEHKNQKLVEYAYINSHILRAPLARIQGLINLIETSTDENSTKEYLTHLKSTTGELDSIVTSITQILNNEDQKKLSQIQERVRTLYKEFDE